VADHDENRRVPESRAAVNDECDARASAAGVLDGQARHGAAQLETFVAVEAEVDAAVHARGKVRARDDVEDLGIHCQGRMVK